MFGVSFEYFNNKKIEKSLTSMLILVKKRRLPPFLLALYMSEAEIIVFFCQLCLFGFSD